MTYPADRAKANPQLAGQEFFLELWDVVRAGGSPRAAICVGLAGGRPVAAPPARMLQPCLCGREGHAEHPRVHRTAL